MSVAVEFPWLAGNFKICIAAFRVYGEFKVLLGVGQEEFAEFYSILVRPKLQRSPSTLGLS